MLIFIINLIDVGYGSGRRPHSPSANRSSGRSKSPSSRGRSGSRSPYTKRENNYEKRKSSPARRSPRPYDRESRNARAKRSRSPPPPPPPNDRKTPMSNQTSNSGQNTDTLLDLLRRFPVMWQGLLGLKNDTAAVQMHFLSGILKQYLYRYFVIVVRTSSHLFELYSEEGFFVYRLGFESSACIRAKL